MKNLSPPVKKKSINIKEIQQGTIRSKTVNYQRPEYVTNFLLINKKKTVTQ
jgi:hypothetical protein